ncbi:MAG: hypothetical protein HQL82_09035 [Magnetococcales bacterium]|nr:hypothetical protein [Magnetococcales bacterium]
MQSDQDLPIDCFVQQRDGRFLVCDTELAVAAEGETLATAYEVFRERRRERIRLLEEMGRYQPPVVRGWGWAVALGVIRQSLILLGRMAVVLLLILLVLTWAVPPAVDHVVARIESRMDRGLGPMILIGLERVTQSVERMGAGRAEEIAGKIRRIRQGWQPIGQALTEDPLPPAPPASPSSTP